MSGQKRKLVAKAVDDALFSLWQAAFAKEGGEYAACILAHVIARDPTYEPEPWALYALRRHRTAVTEVLRANTL